jgi:hypothetical protein
MIFFRQLETMYSRQDVLDGIKLALGTGTQDTLSVDELQVALETTLGTSLAGYFDAWVHGSGAPAWPRASVMLIDEADGDWRVEVATTTTDGVARGCAFHVRLNLMNGENLDVLVNNGVAGGPYPPVTITPVSPPVSYSLDPLKECLVYPATGFAEPPRTGAEPWRVRR